MRILRIEGVSVLTEEASASDSPFTNLFSTSGYALFDENSRKNHVRRSSKIHFEQLDVWNCIMCGVGEEC